jgi:hypothetical protein
LGGAVSGGGQANDLKDLFAYHGNDGSAGTETGDLFAGLDVETAAPAARSAPAKRRRRGQSGGSSSDPPVAVDGENMPWVHHREEQAPPSARQADDGVGGGVPSSDPAHDDGDGDGDDDDTAILRRTPWGLEPSQ